MCLTLDEYLQEGLERDWSRAPRIRTFIEKWAVIQNSHDAPMYERLVRKIRKDVDRLVSCSPNIEGEAQESSQAACTHPILDILAGHARPHPQPF